MADTKISALPASTTPLAGTEVLPIVQSGATKKVSVADLTAGRAISATQVTVSTGSVVIGTAGQGIDFSADPSAPGMTSELLDDYEEGTFTPTIAGISGGAISYNQQLGRYTKIGRQVTAWFLIEVNTNTHTVGNAAVALPFSASAGGYTGNIGLNTTAKTDLTQISFFVGDNTPYFYDRLGVTAGAASITNGCYISGTIAYFTS